MFEKQYISLVPGPVQVEPRVLHALSQPVVTHLHEDWAGFYTMTADKMRKIFHTAGALFLMDSSGTGCVEAAITSTVAPGEKILVLTNGLFGDRMGQIAQYNHLECELLRFPGDTSLDPAALESRLARGLGSITAVGAVYSESQNGILNPIREIAKICNRYDVPLIVDAVSAIGGVEFDMDGWGIDIAVCGGQKCLGCVVGIGILAVNDKAWRYIENKKGSGYYFNLNIWRDSTLHNVIHPYPWSMSESLVFALNAAADIVLEEGLENRWKRHRELYDYYAGALSKLGFEMFVPREYASPTVISIKKPPGIEVEKFKDHIKQKYGILIGTGIYQQRGKLWRIGNMASQATMDRAEKLIDAVEHSLKELTEQ